MKKHALFFSLFILTALYGSFLAVDLHSGFSNNYYSKTVRYICILICLLFVFIAKSDALSPGDHRLMKWAFFLTACADFSISMVCHYDFLTFGCCGELSKYQFGIGMGLFLVVQILYIKRHKRNFVWNAKEIVTAVIIFGVMIIKLLELGNTLLRGLGASNKILFFVALVYAIVLCISVWMAIGTIWRGHFPKTIAWVIAVGMFLFFLCDNSLGRYIIYPQTAPIEEASSFIKYENPVRTTRIDITGDQVAVYTKKDNARTVVIPFTSKTIFGILVWLFYLPAQVLLMLSAYNPRFLNRIFGLVKLD